MTVKCVFCKDTKIEPGIPGPCVWCEQVGASPVAVGYQLAKGFTDPVGDCEKFEAGITVNSWLQRIVVYGDSPADAEALRDHIMLSAEREAALREELGQCGSMAAMIEEREWAEHAGTGPVSSRVESAFTQLHNELAALRESYESMRDRKNSIVDLQQRLNVAEQRGALAVHLLESIERGGINCVTLGGPSIGEKVRAFIEGREPVYVEPGTKASGLTYVDHLAIDNRGFRLDISEMKCITMTTSALNKLGGKK